MTLPNPGMDFDALDTLTAVEMDDIVENIEAIATGLGDGTALTSIRKNNLTIDSNPYKFHVYKGSGSQNSGNNAYAKITFDTEVFDTNNNFDSTTNNRYTAPVAGFYRFYATASFGVAVRDYAIAIYKNGSIILGLDERTGNATYNVSCTGGGLIQAAANDYFEVHAFANTTTGMNLGANVLYFGGMLECRT